MIRFDLTISFALYIYCVTILCVILSIISINSLFCNLASVIRISRLSRSVSHSSVLRCHALRVMQFIRSINSVLVFKRRSSISILYRFHFNFSNSPILHITYSQCSILNSYRSTFLFKGKSGKLIFLFCRIFVYARQLLKLASR